MTGWMDFQQLDWLAAVLLHSLWIGALITLVLILVTRLGRIRNSHYRYVTGVGALLFFVLSVLLLTFFLAPGKSDSPVMVLAFDASSGVSDGIVAHQATGWVAMISTYSPVFLQTWFIGMVFLLLRMLGGYQYLVQVKRKATGHVPDAWLNSIQHIREQWHMKTEVQILASTHVDMPMVFGHIKPVILLPVTMLSGLSQDQLEAIFAHELAHIRRNDYLVHLAQSVIEAVFFFNPFIWWLSKFINQEREQCCDDLALEYCSNPVSYAEALSGLEEYRSILLAMGLSNGKKPLLQRIRRIIEPEYTPTTSYRILLVSLLLSVGFLSFTVLQPTETQDWIPVKSDYQVEEPVPVGAKIHGPIVRATVASPAVRPLTVQTDTVPEVQEREFFFFDTDTTDWDERFDSVVPDVDFDFDMEPFVFAVPDVDWESVMPVLKMDSVFLYFEDIPEISVDAFVVPEIDLDDFDMDFQFSPGLYAMDTTKLTDAEREELRQAREELRRAREEIRMLQRDHQEKIREEMQKIRELQRREWEIQREEMGRMQRELRGQFGSQEAVISREKQADMMQEMREAQAEMREVNRELALRMREESGVRQRQIEREMARAREEMARAQVEMNAARQEMRLYRGFHEEVERMLRKDGYLEEGESLKKLKIGEDSFRFNGKKVDDRDLDKYLKLYERRYGSLKGARYEYSE